MIYIKHKLKLTLVVLVICFCQKSTAQLYPVGPFDRSYFNPGFGINAGMIFNLNDFFFDFGLGFEDTGFDYSASLNIAFRPFDKKVIFEEDENLFYQYHEGMIIPSIDLEKRFFFLGLKDHDRLGIYLGGKFGYLFGRYRGLSKSLTREGIIAPNAGFVYESKVIRLSLGYLHLDIPSYEQNNKIQFKLSLIINNEKVKDFQ